MAEDVVWGRWCNIKYTINRRWCNKCKKICSAPMEHVLPGEHFGTDIMAQIVAMRNMGISFNKIQKIIAMIHDRYISTSIIEDICTKTAKRCRPLYDKLMASLEHCKVIYGDETGWFFKTDNYWVWVFISHNTIFYHIAPTRSMLVAHAILKTFEGILVSDSYGGWNRLGYEQQKCLLHYFRNLYETLDENEHPEFKAFFKEIYHILKSAIKLHKRYKDKVPKYKIQKLQNRINALAYGKYKDKDCKRIAKRLKREGESLLTFLRHGDLEYHNNKSERAVRIFSLMRRTLYGNRSEDGMLTTETLATIQATCELRGINAYKFFKDYLDGKVTDIPLSADIPKALPAPKQLLALPAPLAAPAA